MDWRPIETWNRKNKWVILFQPHITVRNKIALEARCCMPGDEGFRKTTHWMPLPEPPEDQN